MTISTKHTFLLLCSALVLSACEESSSTSARKSDAAADDDTDAAVDTPSDSDDAGSAGDDAGTEPSEDGGDPPGPSDCFTDPKTYLEIINACTDAEKLDKMPTLPLLLADGGLPALP
jgi:hypothetical protein